MCSQVRWIDVKDFFPEEAVAGWMPPLHGRGLRLLLLFELRSRQQATVADLVEALMERGYPLGGRPSKVISDALRTEVRRGRVIRLGRGRYLFGRVTPTTERRMRVFARHCHPWIAAVRAGRVPPPTPRDPHWPAGYHDPSLPPWASLAWLWQR